MIKQINLDMDGTFVNLYGVNNWLEYLINEDTTPYEVAKPLVNLNSLARILNRLQKNGWKLKVISWLSKNASDQYNEQVEQAKRKWLSKHLASVQFDEISIVNYGTPKETLGKGILFDDELNNRKNWKGKAYDVNNLIETLKTL